MFISFIWGNQAGELSISSFPGRLFHILLRFIEGIGYLIMSDAQFNRLYNGAQVLASTETTRDKALALQEMKKLYEDGVITAGEYEQKRKKLLDRI